MYKIAIIEDNRATADMIATTIHWEAIGCTLCGVANDGTRGLSLIQQQRPNIIISDIRMPGMDGLTLAETLHREMPDTRVIFVSAYDEFAYAQKALRLHAFEYLLKPLENEKLIDSIRRAVDDLRSAKQGDDTPPASARDSLVSAICNYIDACPHRSSLQETADHFGFSASHISYIIKKETGENYIDLVVRSRLKFAKRLLKDYSCRIEEIAETVGYKNYISFYKMFVKYEGISPRDYRKGDERP